MPIIQSVGKLAQAQFGKTETGFLNPQRIVESSGIKEGMKIADFGSGSGDFTVVLAKAVGENGLVTAVDIMESKLESVRAKAKFNGLNNIQTIHSNLEILGSSGLDDNSQDMAFLINVLFQSEYKEGIIKEALRVLKKGYKLVVIEWKKNTGGLGPPDELRTNQDTMRDLVVDTGLIFERDIDAGIFHYGLIFNNPS